MTQQERYINAKRALFNKAYSELNEKQRESVFSVNGPLLVLAGAGSGKTTVLVKRIAFIIKYGNAYESEYVPFDIDERHIAELEKAVELSPEEIRSDILPEFVASACEPWKMLAITFTNKAANEIKNRLGAAVGNDDVAREIWAGTFHSVCMRILRVHAEKLGYRSGFSIYDSDDTKKAILSSMKDLNIDEKAFPLKSVISIISDAKNKLITPTMFANEAGSDYRLQKIAKIYDHYQNEMMKSNVLDFDDIIMKTVELLKQNNEVREYYQAKFKYVCIDEYQDTNYAQFVLTALLAGGYKNLMVVGDDDQSIYKFRGATIENILNFDKKFENSRVVKLEQNYRSTQTILDAANAVIANNVGRHGKSLWTNSDQGNKILVKELDDQNAESRFVSDKINTMVANKEADYKDFAVLYRNNAQSSSIERTFAKSGVPYRMLGGLRFNDRKEIRDIVAYLHLIENHNDRERLMRIINEPKRKIGTATLDAVKALSDETGKPIFEIIETAGDYVALSKSASKLRDFANLINELGELASSGVPLRTLVTETIERSGYKQMLIDGGEAEKDRLDNVNEFVSSVIEYENSFENDEDNIPTLSGFLEENALVADVDKYDENANAVVLMTIHSAKGLEFPIVFLPGMEDGIFPGMQSIMGSEAEIEEERRLAYVAITRAKKQLIITYANNRLIYGKTQYNPPSRFIKEIPEELTKLEGKKASVPKTHGQFGDYYQGYDARRETITIIPQTKKPIIQNSAKDLFAEGDRVIHKTFGEGDILSVKQMGADILYEIAFDTAGTKKLMASFAKLQKK